MIATSDPFVVMVEGVSHVCAWRLEIDLPNAMYADVSLKLTNPLVDTGESMSALEIDASITTDMAEGTRLEEGYSSQQATFTLSGPVDPSDVTKDAAWLFGRYSTTSPLYRSDVFMIPVRIYLGLYPDGANGTPEMLRKFTGFVEDYTQDADGNVSFTCLDGRQLLRSLPSIPPVITTPPYNASLTSEFAVDELLRNATTGAVSSWPAKRSQCVLAVGFRSSLWPEIGRLDSTTPFTVAGPPMFTPGAMGSAVAPSNPSVDLQLFYATATPVSGSNSVFVEAWASGSTSIAVSDYFGGFDQASLTVSYEPGSQMVATVTSSIGEDEYVMPLPADDGHPHYIAGRITWVAGAWTARLFYDTTTATSASRLAPSSRPSALLSCVTVRLGNTLEALQVTTESAPVSNAGFSPLAVLDPSLNPLQIIPGIEGDPWQTIQQIAEAELAIARFDESTGQFRYTNRATLAQTPIGRTISALSSLETIGGVESTAASVVNRAQIGYTGWNFAATRTVVSTVAIPRRVPAGGSFTLNPVLADYAVGIDTSVQMLPQGSTDQTHSYYRASTTKSGLNRFSGTLTFTVTQPQPSMLQIVISNPTKQDAWLVASADDTDIPAGTPFLQIAGMVVTAQDEVVADYQWPTADLGGASSSRFGEVLFSATGNPWSQDPSVASLAEYVVEESYQPRPNFTGMEIMPDPRIQIGDKALVDDTARTGAKEYVRIFGYTITYTAGDAGSGDTYSMTIDGRTLANPGQWLLGVSGRSELASTTYL